MNARTMKEGEEKIAVDDPGLVPSPRVDCRLALATILFKSTAGPSWIPSSNARRTHSPTLRRGQAFAGKCYPRSDGR